MVADPAGASQVFSDDEVEAALDAHREDVRYLELTAAETLTPTGVQWLEYYADRAPWEADEQIVNASWQVVTPATADRFVGKWMFATSTLPPLYVVGKVYDLYAAAADLLEAWAAKLKLEFDFGTDAERFERSQKLSHILQLVGQYRAKQRPRCVSQVRSDAWGRW